MDEQNPWDLDWSQTKISAAAAPRGAGAGVSKTDEQSLAAARDKAMSAEQSSREIRDIQPVLSRYKGGTDKEGWMDLWTPEASDGTLNWLTGLTAGKVVRGLGLVSGQDVQDRARIKAFTVSQVKASHKDEKGVQTNQDDSLEMMRDVGADKTRSHNAELLMQARIKNAQNQNYAKAMSYWTSRYGSTAKANPTGQTFDQYWGIYKGMIDDQLRGRPNQRMQNRAASAATRAKAKAGIPNTTGWKVQR